MLTKGFYAQNNAIIFYAGPLSIDTSGGRSRFVNGIIGTVDMASGGGIIPILMTKQVC